MAEHSTDGMDWSDVKPQEPSKGKSLKHYLVSEKESLTMVK